MINPGNMYYRDSKITKAPHNAFTSMTNIRTQMERLGYNKEVKDFKKNRSFLGLSNNRYSLLNQKEFEQNIERCASYVYSYLRRNDIIEP